MKKIIAAITAVWSLLLVKMTAFAQIQTGNSASSPTPSNVNITLLNPLGTQNGTIEGIVSSIMDWLIKLGAPVAALMIIVGGIQILMSGGSPDKFEKGRNTILYTAIGYGIILLGDGIIKIVQKILQG